jgi:hypothetical protein
MFTRGICGYVFSGDFNFMKKVSNIGRWRVVHHVIVVNRAGLFDGFTQRSKNPKHLIFKSATGRSEGDQSMEAMYGVPLLH